MSKKYKVVARAFNECAYLPFFVRWYLRLGFDNITLLKADADHPVYNELKALYPADKLTIIDVENEGNGILRTHYAVYRDLSYDWVLNVDCDEFLVFDMSKWPDAGSMLQAAQDYITGLDGHKKTHLQQIAFRWVCINKFDNRDRDSATINGLVKSYPLHIFRYQKCIGAPAYMVDDSSRINCHYYFTVDPELVPRAHLVEDKLRPVRDNSTGYLPSDGKAFCWGFILHINTRSLANALTKALTTQLRDNKKIGDLPTFKNIINNWTGTENEKAQFKNLMNKKAELIDEMRDWHAFYGHRVNMDTQVLNQIKTLPSELRETVICQANTEMAKLEEICIERGIDWSNMCRAMSDF
jgi:hypothetical protein